MSAAHEAGPALYHALAGWWPLMSSPADYEEEAGLFGGILAERVPDRRSLLELGSGGGNNASHMKVAFERVTLVDVAPGMVEVSRALNPECEHHVGDMRSVRLGRVFDCVFIHDAICYMTTVEDLRRAVETAWVHCRPGGVALFVPDYVAETFRPDTSSGGHDGEDRALRYLAWSWDPDPADTTFLVDYAYLLRDPEGGTRVVHDRHEEGLFPQAAWEATLREIGFTPEVVRVDHSEVDYPLLAFVGRRPA